MLDDGPLLAPSCVHVTSSLHPSALFPWLCQLDIAVVVEIFTLSDKSVLYEMAQYCLQRPWHRSAAVTPGHGLAVFMRFFSDTLRRFEHHTLLQLCEELVLNHMEAALRCIRLQPALERLLPLEGAQASAPGADALVHSASRCGSVLSSETAAECVAEEVDREKWVFRDVEEEGPQRLSQQGSTTSSAGSDLDGPASRRLRLGGDAKLAYSVTLFLWAAVRLLVRRIEMLHEFPPDHPLLVLTREADVPKLSALGDNFEALMAERKQAMRRGIRLFQQAEWAEAMAELSKALALPAVEHGGTYHMLNFRARCHFHLGAPQRAIEDCTAALSYDPVGFSALCLRACAHEALGQLDATKRDLKQLLRLYPSSDQVQDLQARLTGALHQERSPRLPEKPDHPNGAEVAATPPRDSPLSLTTAESGPAASPIAFSPRGRSFTSALLNIDLAALPVHPDPEVDDTPYLSEFVQSGVPVEYTVCGGKELGRGAFGRVYKAVHATEGWLLAVKEVDAKEVEGCEHLLRAFELMATMKHNNVVKNLGMRRLPGFYHIVMEYCCGGTLRGLVNDVRGLSLPLMRKFATQILQGLRYMHGLGLLHRDIKASNILLRDDGMAKLADFGTCMRIPEEGQPRCDAVKGTVLWMAPETFRGRYCTESDVWSFGCVLIEMATAKDPWSEQNFREQLTAMVFIATRPDALPAIPPSLVDDLSRHFFHCCIARDPADRVSADLLLRHPWLNQTPADPSITSSPPCTSRIQEQYSEAEVGGAHGFPWATTSNLSDTLFAESQACDLLVESMTQPAF